MKLNKLFNSAFVVYTLAYPFLTPSTILAVDFTQTVSFHSCDLIEGTPNSGCSYYFLPVSIDWAEA